MARNSISLQIAIFRAARTDRTRRFFDTADNVPHSAMASDPNSNANVDDVKTTHFSLDWIADFDACQLRGFALLRLTVQAEAVDAVVLDTRDLDIASVAIIADAPSDVPNPDEIDDCDPYADDRVDLLGCDGILDA